MTERVEMLVSDDAKLLERGLPGDLVKRSGLAGLIDRPVQDAEVGLT
jgi:hypothetical protein